MKELERLLQQSIGEYRRMRDLVQGLAVELGSIDPDDVLARAGRIESMLAAAREVDPPLAAELTAEMPERLLPLVRERLELLRQVKEENRQLMPRLQAMLAVAAADLAELRQGQTAIAGYHSGVAATGRRIDSC